MAPERGVDPLLIEQHIVRASLDDPAAIENDQLVNSPDRREPMRDDDGGPSGSLIWLLSASPFRESDGR